MPLLLHEPLVHVLQQFAALERDRRAAQQNEPIERSGAGEENPLADIGGLRTTAEGENREGRGGGRGEAKGGGDEVVWELGGRDGLV